MNQQALRDPLGIAGTIIAEKYRVSHMVGEGGFSVVYKAEHTIWKQPVAIKCFKVLANAPAGSIKLYEALDYSTPIPSPDKGNVIQTAIEDAFTQILTGAVDVEEGLNTLNDDIQSNL